MVYKWSRNWIIGWSDKFYCWRTALISIHGIQNQCPKLIPFVLNLYLYNITNTKILYFEEEFKFHDKIYYSYFRWLCTPIIFHKEEYLIRHMYLSVLWKKYYCFNILYFWYYFYCFRLLITLFFLSKLTDFFVANILYMRIKSSLECIELRFYYPQKPNPLHSSVLIFGPLQKTFSTEYLYNHLLPRAVEYSWFNYCFKLLIVFVVNQKMIRRNLFILYYVIQGNTWPLQEISLMVLKWLPAALLLIIH